MRRVKTGGGWRAIKYSLTMANKVGWWKFWNAMRSQNACKTCAVGMGGQRGGMVNEAGHFPEVCKKSFQAMISDMQGAIKPEFFQEYSIAKLKELSPRELESCGRLSFPVIATAGATHYQPISWDDALSKLAAQLELAGPMKTFFYASGRSSNEAGFLLQLFARLFGTNYVNNCSYYCHQASGVGLSSSLGTGTATVSLEDLERADFVMLLGGNPASNHPRLMRSLMQVRRANGQVVVINPVKELGLMKFRVPSDVRSMLFGCDIASFYLQPHIGGDVGFLAGMAKAILEAGKQDTAFIDKATEGFAEFEQHIKDLSWQEIETQSGISKADNEGVAQRYLKSERAVFAWTMGITHHLHGVDNVRSIVNVALLRGMVGRPNAGLLPIRGHSNVQGIGTVGVTPTLKAGIVERMVKRLGVQPPTQPGLDTMACMHAADRGELTTALCLGGNLYGSNPDSAFAHRALAKLQQITYMNTTLNTTHAWGLGQETMILPVLARDEEPQPTTQESMFNYVRFSQGGPSRVPEARSEVSVLSELGQRVLSSTPVDWKSMESHRAVRQLMSELIPGLEPINSIDDDKKEFHIPGRIIHTPVFPTLSGKAHFHPAPLPKQETPAGSLRLMTVRSEGQFNTVVYEEEDLYRGQERRDVILLHQEDMQRLGLQENQKVTVRSTTGAMHNILVRPFDIRAGNALMYFPEANVLVPSGVDPYSKTPAFKSIAVTVEAETEGLVTAEALGEKLRGRKR
ncbi:MAG: FdhF/YdeP family oxidoreductase [Gemmatales bacterium]